MLHWVTLLVLGCGVENSVKEIGSSDVEYPSLLVEPVELDFGVVEPTEMVTEVVTFQNNGPVALEITGIQLDGGAFTAVSAAPIGPLAANESTEMVISYSPQNLSDIGWLTVDSTDPVEPEILVPLTGQGAIPLLIIEPAQLDMGWVEINTESEDSFVLRNDGAADLTVSQLLMVGAEFFITDAPEVPFVLEPGAEEIVDVKYAPVSYGEHIGTMWVESDTPAGTTQAVIEGSSAPKPEAICSVDPAEIAPHYETATWIGEDSFDASGAEITEYDWTLLEKPEGSTAFITNGGANRPYFSPDLAGTYVGQLIVYNEWGRASEPCEATLEAIPRESLWVETYWQYPDDDMDLHILRPGGSLESDNDCFYFNCVSGGWLDWGVIGAYEDDPSLDIDDIPGTGPENTNILDPEEGVFEVWIHDYPGSVYSGANEVTVKIYLSGELAWEGTKSISGENSYTQFASIAWPEMEITEH